MRAHGGLTLNAKRTIFELYFDYIQHFGSSICSAVHCCDLPQSWALRQARLAPLCADFRTGLVAAKSAMTGAPSMY